MTSDRKLSKWMAERIAEVLIRNRRLMQGDGVQVIAAELAPLDAVVEAAERLGAITPTIDGFCTVCGAHYRHEDCTWIELQAALQQLQQPKETK